MPALTVTARLTRSGPLFGDPVDTKRINLLLHRHPTFNTLFDENRCLIQNKAKLMWVQTGAILMAKILSLVA